MPSSFIIKPIHLRNAERLGVNIKPSYNRKKKLDIYDFHNQYICSIGDINFADYESYIRTHGRDYANFRKRMFETRHNKTRHILGTPAYYSWQILWS